MLFKPSPRQLTTIKQASNLCLISTKSPCHAEAGPHPGWVAGMISKLTVLNCGFTLLFAARSFPQHRHKDSSRWRHKWFYIPSGHCLLISLCSHCLDLNGSSVANEPCLSFCKFWGEPGRVMRAGVDDTQRSLQRWQEPRASSCWSLSCRRWLCDADTTCSAHSVLFSIIDASKRHQS